MEIFKAKEFLDNKTSFNYGDEELEKIKVLYGLTWGSKKALFAHKIRIKAAVLKNLEGEF